MGGGWVEDLGGGGGGGAGGGPADGQSHDGRRDGSGVSGGGQMNA